MKPKVSVLISVYNGEDTIEQSMRSLLNQTFSDYEIIVINDGSTDQTAEIINGFNDKRIKLYNLSHIGLPKALNHGINFCTGKYIARMDADDWSHPDRLALQEAYLEKNSHVGVISCLVEYDGDREGNLGYALHVDWMNQLLTHNNIQRKRFEDAPVANPSCMFRKSLIEDYGNYRETNSPEDYEFWLRLLNKGVIFHKISKYLFKWADLPNRITRTLDAYSQPNFFKLKSEYLSHWIDKKYDKTPDIYIFGTGKYVNQKTQSLERYGLSVSKFLEVKPPPYSDSRKIHFEELPSPDQNILVLSYIGDREGKQQVIKFLKFRGYVEGENFLMMA